MKKECESLLLVMDVYRYHRINTSLTIADHFFERAYEEDEQKGRWIGAD
ncbi:MULTISPECIES: hypothetical protein [Bacillaceae]|nr:MULTISPECIES: hypothetical protein [Bacillaceae]